VPFIQWAGWTGKDFDAILIAIKIRITALGESNKLTFLDVGLGHGNKIEVKVKEFSFTVGEFCFILRLETCVS
jgi:hypothetical protein